MRRQDVVGKGENWWIHGDMGSFTVVVWVLRQCLPAYCSDLAFSSSFIREPTDDDRQVIVFQAHRCVIVLELVAPPYGPVLPPCKLIAHLCVRAILPDRARRYGLRGLVLLLWAYWATYCVRFRIGGVFALIRLLCASGNRSRLCVSTSPILLRVITLIQRVIARSIREELRFLRGKHQGQV